MTLVVLCPWPVTDITGYTTNATGQGAAYHYLTNLGNYAIMRVDRMNKNSKHYHVLIGLAGRLPSVNSICRTKREAEESLCYFRDWLQEMGISLHGSIRKGKYDIVGQPEYLKIEECYKVDCLQNW